MNKPRKSTEDMGSQTSLSDYQGNHKAKKELLDGSASIARVLGSERWAEIVDILAQGERPVDGISHEIDQTITNTSQHLQQLPRAGLVKTRRERASEHLAELDELAASYLGDRSILMTVTRPELRERIGDGDLIALDVRPEAEFEAGLIAGAMSVTHKELETRLDQLPNDRIVVSYCRGPYCVFADDAARTLDQAWHQGRTLGGSLRGVERRRLPVEASTTDLPGHGHAS